MKTRESNIELLRIFAILGVIMLHYNNTSMGGGLKYVEAYSINYFLLMIIESLTICAVDLFMLISGYFSCKTNKTVLYKPLSLIIQVMIFSVGWYCLTGMLKGRISLTGILESLIPANYFVILYCCVYLLSPYINNLYTKMTTHFILLLVVLFSGWPTVIDLLEQLTKKTWDGLSTIGLYGSQWGYQIVNFIMMYLIGMYMRKNIDRIRQMKTINIIICLLINLFIITSSSIGCVYAGFERNIAWNYSNPFVILEAYLLFALFVRFNIGKITLINKLSAACFTVFLSHTFFIFHIGVEKVAKAHWIILLVHILSSAVILYILGFIIFIIYDFIYKKTIYKLIKKEITITQL